MHIKNTQQLLENVKEYPELQKKRRDLLRILESVIDSVDPHKAVADFLKNNPIHTEDYTNIYLVGFGKASIGMSKAVIDRLPVKKGAINTNEDTKECPPNILITTAGHPLPNQQSINGTEKILGIISSCTPQDLLIILISGGGSALLCKPLVSLTDLQTTTDLLLKSGATIEEINTIRKHLSTIKGGQLLKHLACPALCLIISDIVNDPIEFIASGPTSPDTTTFQDCLKILSNHHLLEKIPASVKEILEKGVNGALSETPKPDNPIFKKITNQIIANNTIACKAAEQTAHLLGYNTHIISTTLIGEARKIGPQLIKNVAEKHSKNTIYISGGETTVTLTGNGLGGRNQEMALSTVENIATTPYVFCSFATDGIDGNTAHAGALVDASTKIRAQQYNLSEKQYLNNNDSNTYFQKLNDLINTGPTGTNVMDIQLIIT